MITTLPRTLNPFTSHPILVALFPRYGWAIVMNGISATLLTTFYLDHVPPSEHLGLPYMSWKGSYSKTRYLASGP